MGRRQEWVTIAIGGQRLTLTDENCNVFIFGDRYKEYNHVYVQTSAGGFYVFDNPALIDRLNESDLYPCTFQRKPSRTDEAAYARWRNDKPITEQEIASFKTELGRGVRARHWQELSR